jgi:type VI secretion system protein ImpA
MPAPPTVEFERLLAPISPENPSGVELREDEQGSRAFSELFDASKKARNDERERLKQEISRQVESGGSSSADPSLRQEIDDPDWLGVREQAIEILATHSKDLWVAAWLTDALVRTDGIAGLRDGLHVIHELSTRYWDAIHPAPEENSYENTTSQLTSLFAAPLASAIRNVPLAHGADCTFGHYRHAATSDNAALGPILSAVQETPASFYVDLVDAIQSSLANLSSAAQFFMDRCGPEATPNPSAVRTELEECLNNVRTVAADKLESAAAAEGQEGEGGGEAAGKAGGKGAGFDVSGQIASREDAFRTLVKIAEYFKKAEPTSPVPILLDYAVRLGKKPFTDLILELVSDESVRDEVYRRIGARLQSGEAEE